MAAHSERSGSPIDSGKQRVAEASVEALTSARSADVTFGPWRPPADRGCSFVRHEKKRAILHIILLGRPGAGKGTQGTRLAERFGVTHVSTGDLLRNAMAADTPLGRSVRSTVEHGQFVPDAVMNGLVAEFVTSTEGGILFDGYPRTMPQCETLSSMLGPCGPDLAVDLDVPATTVLDRVRRRRVCSSCGVIGRGDAARPAACALCGSALGRRADDDPEILLRRLWAYERETKPVASWFARTARLVRVDGTGLVDAVSARLNGTVARWFEPVHRPAQTVSSQNT